MPVYPHSQVVQCRCGKRFRYGGEKGEFACPACGVLNQIGHATRPSIAASSKDESGRASNQNKNRLPLIALSFGIGLIAILIALAATSGLKDRMSASDSSQVTLASNTASKSGEPLATHFKTNGTAPVQLPKISPEPSNNDSTQALQQRIQELENKLQQRDSAPAKPELPVDKASPTETGVAKSEEPKNGPPSTSVTKDDLKAISKQEKEQLEARRKLLEKTIGKWPREFHSRFAEGMNPHRYAQSVFFDTDKKRQDSVNVVWLFCSTPDFLGPSSYLAWKGRCELIENKREEGEYFLQFTFLKKAIGNGNAIPNRGASWSVDYDSPGIVVEFESDGVKSAKHYGADPDDQSLTISLRRAYALTKDGKEGNEVTDVGFAKKGDVLRLELRKQGDHSSKRGDLPDGFK